MACVLVTRPREDALTLARELESRGHAPLIAPLLAVEPVPFEAAPLDDVQALVLTSANAAPALADVLGAEASNGRLPVFAVGRATAAAARSAGCRRIYVAKGDARELARLIGERCRPGDGALLHLAGAEVRPGLAETLAASGFTLCRLVVYRALAAATLPPEVGAALAARRIDAVLLFSPRTARTFAGLVRAANLADGLKGTEALCLSAAVGEACRELPWRRLRVAARPAAAALLDLLDGARGRW